ncbi:MAG: hypothetical protein LUD18_00170, partial [Lachnospiraceae bacterium]|nr:hypothetical protein [Lachnospiraceae bacterium]
DTNVLYWYKYQIFIEKESETTKRRASDYYNFVDRLVADGYTLVTTRINVTELINIVEKHEYDIYQTLHPEAKYSRKDLRRMPEQRMQLKRILKTTLTNVRTICTVQGFELTDSVLDKCINTLEEHKCDVFDFAVLSYYKDANLYNIITDDSDFSTIDGDFYLYTANENSLLI